MHAAVLSSLIWLAAAPPSNVPTEVVPTEVVPTEVVVVEHCVVSLIEEAQAPAKEAGQLVEILAKEGVMVMKGDLMASLASEEAEMRHKLTVFELRIAEEQATNDVSIRAAVATHAVAVAEYEAGVEINSKARGAVTPAELRRLELTAKRADLQTAVAKMEYKVAGMTRDARKVQAEAARDDIKKRKIYAPQDGVVVQVYRHVGEWVQAGNPLLRVVRMDKLRVEGFVNTNAVSPSDIVGQPVTIEVQIGRGVVRTVASRVDFVSPLVQADGAYRVWAEVENLKVGGYWTLQPGLEATMKIEAKKSGNQTARRR